MPDGNADSVPLYLPSAARGSIDGGSFEHSLEVEKNHVVGGFERFFKVLVDGDSSEILGAAILGVNGDEAVHTLIDVMYAKARYTVISRAVHIHPTVAELIPTVLQNLKPLE